MNIHFVLIEPSVPENIGATARAIKTMGFRSLWIVNSVKHMEDKARYLAHGSEDILKNIRTFHSFEQMIRELDFSIATTSKSRSVRYDYLNGTDLPGLLKEKEPITENAGVIFGREKYGLSNNEINQCDITSSIPLSTSYPSLNLGQSAMIYAYILSELNLVNTKKREEQNTQKNELKALKNKIAHLLPEIGIEKSSNIYGRIFERLMMSTQDDIHLLHSVINKINEKFKKNETK